MNIQKSAEKVLYGGWVRLCETVNTKGDLIPVDSDKLRKLTKTGAEKDWYTSLYYYTEEAKKHWDDKKSMAGYRGPAYSNRLLFDFDSSEDLGLAQSDAVLLLERLVNEGIEVSKSCKVFFSGGKGFHVEVFVDNKFTPEELKPICSNLAVDLKTFDQQIYNTTRLVRLVNTKHQKTGLYKIELSPDDLLNLSIDQIKEKAQKPINYPDFELQPVKDLNFLKKYEGSFSPLAKPIVVDMDDTDGIRGLDQVDFKRMPRGTPRCIHALANGVMAPGERNHLFFRLAAYYRNQGLTKHACYGLLKGVAMENYTLYPENDKVTKEELWNTVINSVYSENWKQIPGAVGTDEQNELLKKYCTATEEHTDRKCSLHSSTKKARVVQIGEVCEDFSKFAESFDKNTVKTGINFIDTNMNIARGTTNLLVGAAGCHRKGEKVLMFDGSLKNVENVKVGEKLMGPDSKPRIVLQLKRGLEPMYKVTFDRGKCPKNKPKYFNESHKLHFLDSQGGTKKDKIVQMTIKDYLENYPEYRKPRCFFIRQEVNYKEKYLNINPYILGVWLGDGHSSGPRFTFQDEELIKALKVYAKELKENFKVTKQKNRCDSFAITGNGILKNFLRGYDLLENKHIPLDYKTSSKEHRLQLLAGLIDTDGYIHNNTIEITQKRKILSEDIQSLCFSLGFQATLQKVQKTCTNNGKTGIYYRIHISGNLEEIPTRLKRKKLLARKQIKKVNRLSFQLKKVAEKEEYYGFTVDKDNLYLDDDYLIIRNSGKTTLALNIMENANKLGQHTIMFSLDMHKNLVYLKLAQKVTNYSQKELIKMFKTKDPRTKEVKEAISKRYGKTFFDFSTTLSLEQMRDRIYQVQDEYGIDISLVVIDYASRINAPDHKDVYSSARYNAMASTGIANETDAAFIIISQISRNTGNGCTPIRTKRAAKDSGDWEESATNVITCWRPFMGDSDLDDVMRLFLAKNRMGRELEEVLHWDGAKGEIRDMNIDEKAIYEEMRGNKAEREYLRDLYAAKTGNSSD